MMCLREAQYLSVNKVDQAMPMVGSYWRVVHTSLSTIENSHAKDPCSSMLLPWRSGYESGIHSFYDFEPLLSLHRQQTRMAAGTIVVCLLSFFKYAHYSPKYGILVRTITRAARDLIQFLFMVRPLPLTTPVSRQRNREI